MAGSILTSPTGDILTAEDGSILVTELPIDVTQVNYFFQFVNEVAARTDPVVGPYFGTSPMLLGLWVYDLAITKQPIQGYWFLIQQSGINSALTASVNLKLAFVFPGPLLLLNALPSGIGNNFEIIFPGCATAIVNDWSKFVLR